MFKKEISTSNAPIAIGPYSQGIKLGDFVYLSGQLPVNPATDKIESDDAAAQAEQSLLNIEAILAQLSLETRHIVKTTVYITDMNDFGKINEVYAKHFSQPFPARSCVQVAALPKGAKIEIECFAIDSLVYEKQAESGCQNCHKEKDSCGDDCGCENCGD